MKMSFHQKAEVLSENATVLNIVLDCELSKSSETRQIRFDSSPTTPLDIKEKVEEEFSIPSCIQSLHYQTVLLRDSDNLRQHTHFRSGDTFNVHYLTKGDCSRVHAVIEWLKGLLGLLQAIKTSESSADDANKAIALGHLFVRTEDLILSGMRDGVAQDLCLHLFYPWKDKRTYVNKLDFHHKGGLDVLMKVYDLMVEKDWGDIGINSEFHLYLECLCSQAVANYTQTFMLRRQIVQLGGLEMCIKTLLRRKVRRNGGCVIRPDSLMKSALEIALYAVCNLSELPECQVPLAMRRDVIDQTMGIALHPSYDCKTAIVSASLILCITQTPEAHPYLAKSEIVESMLEMCDLKHEMVIERETQSTQGESEDPMAVYALQGYTSIVLAQIGLGSPSLLCEAIPLPLQQQILKLMSTMLETASPAEISRYEEKEGLVWGTFLPYLRFLYNSSTMVDKSIDEKRSDSAAVDDNKEKDLRGDLYVHCCNVLLHGLENALSRDIHFQILLKEGLLDYSMCLSAVLPQACRFRARALVSELAKHRQLEPPSLSTIARAHIAKKFCGLQAVMEMHSIREFVYRCLSTS